MKTENADNSRTANSELKNVILELFNQQREMIARLAEKDRANDEKDRMITGRTTRTSYPDQSTPGKLRIYKSQLKN